LLTCSERLRLASKTWPCKSACAPVNFSFLTVLLLLLRRKLFRPALDGTLLSSDFILGLLSPPSAGVSAPMMAAEGYSIIMLELSSTGANGGDYPQPTATRGYEAKYYIVVFLLIIE